MESTLDPNVALKRARGHQEDSRRSVGIPDLHAAEGLPEGTLLLFGAIALAVLLMQTGPKYSNTVQIRLSLVPAAVKKSRYSPVEEDSDSITSVESEDLTQQEVDDSEGENS